MIFWKFQFITTKLDNLPWYELPEDSEYTLPLLHLIEQQPIVSKNWLRNETVQIIEYVFNSKEDAEAFRQLVTSSDNLAVKEHNDYIAMLEKKLGVSYRRECKIVESE